MYFYQVETYIFTNQKYKHIQALKNYYADME